MKKDQPDNNMQDFEVYPFWKLKTGHRLVVRFLPDLNPHNNFVFIDEYHFHRVEIDGKLTAVLCSALHENNKPCYHCVAAKRAFKKQEQFGGDARKYWRKKQYIGNAIIINDPLFITDSANPKTYKIPLGKMLFDELKNGMTEHRKVKEMPSDYYKGNDFVIEREMQGQYPRYSGGFRKASRLTDEQIKLAEASLINLSEFRPKLYSSNCNDELSKDLMWEILGNE